MTRASAAATPGRPVTFAGSAEEEEDHRSGSVPGPMSGQVTGTAPPGTVGHTILPAALAASSVEHSKMTLLGVALTVTCLAPGAQVSVAAIDLDGSLVIGFAPGEICVTYSKYSIYK